MMERSPSLISERRSFDPAVNLERDSLYLRHVSGSVPLMRVWRNRDCLVLGRFLKAEEEVDVLAARRLAVPVLFRESGGGAVFLDPGTINYSIFIDPDRHPLAGVEESIRLLSYPVTGLLEELGVSWEWGTPGGVFVGGRKVSGCAQACKRGKLLHHGTLLVECDLGRMEMLLKGGGRSERVPVVNLVDVAPGVTVEEAESVLRDVIVRRWPF